MVHDFLDFCDVATLSAAYSKAQRRFGHGLGVGMSRAAWMADPYNEQHANGRLFVAWTYEARRIDPVDVGSYSGTFTGWKRLDPPWQCTSN